MRKPRIFFTSMELIRTEKMRHLTVPVLLKSDVEEVLIENQKLKSEIEVLKYDVETLTTKLAYFENGEP